MADTVFGSWTHRRADAGGSRSLAAELVRGKPRVAWTWEAPAGARIDQVRTMGAFVFAAAMAAAEPGAPGWEHAGLYSIDSASGRVIASRALPDPVPVAALVVEGKRIHAVGTRGGEPVFWYALTAPELRPVHRLPVPLPDAVRADVLDAWALADGGLWLELETGDDRTAYVSIADGKSGDDLGARWASFQAAPASGGPPAARDACESGRSLFVPTDPNVDDDADSDGAVRDALARLEPERGSGTERRARMRRPTWGRLDSKLASSWSHALSAEGLVFAAASTGDARQRIAQVVALDRTSGVERWKTPVARFSVSEPPRAARLSFLSGELVMQLLSGEGAPCSDLVFAGPRGACETVPLGARRRFVLDAALGSTLLAHATKADGSVLVAGFSVDAGARLLGRRVHMQFSIETPDVGGAPVVYAGAGKILVKGARRLVAIAL